MQKIKYVVLLGGLGAVVALSGCSSMSGRGGTAGDRTASQKAQDNEITSTVKADLKEDAVYKFPDVDVNTFDGVVQLSGFVNTQQQKERATQVAREVPGVARVVDAITLKQNMPAPTGRSGLPNQAPVVNFQEQSSANQPNANQPRQQAPVVNENTRELAPVQNPQTQPNTTNPNQYNNPNNQYNNQANPNNPNNP